MDLHAESMSRERDVRSTSDLGELDVEAVPKLRRRHQTNRWLGVGTADARHLRAPLFRCQPIRQAGDIGESLGCSPY